MTLVVVIQLVFVLLALVKQQSSAATQSGLILVPCLSNSLSMKGYSFMLKRPLFIIDYVCDLLLEYPADFDLVDTTTRNSTDPCVERCKSRPRRDDYTYTRGVGAHKIIIQQADWNTARRTCEQDDSHLVIINSVAEAEVVIRLLKSSNSHSSHVGVHDLYLEGEFVTIHGDTLIQTGYNLWQPGEPNNLASDGLDEDCVAVFPDGKLNDISCVNHRTNFICELP